MLAAKFIDYTPKPISRIELHHKIAESTRGYSALKAIPLFDDIIIIPASFIKFSYFYISDRDF